VEFGKPYDAATMGPPVDRHFDAPSPIAQSGFNAEDYVVVRGTIVRVEGGNPVKTFWVRAREINRNYEKTQANTDIWRVDRQIPPGGPAPAEVRTGMSIRVDGYVSISCQPECRIQPMLIDLAQQQAAAQPQQTPSAPAVQPIRFVPQQSAKPNAMTLWGRITRIDLANPASHVFVQANRIVPNKAGRTQEEPTDQLYRVAVGPKDKAPAWASRADAIGATVKVMAYETSSAPCASPCDVSGLDVRPVLSPAATTWCNPVPFSPPGQWESCVPSATPSGVPADFVPFAKHFDAGKPLMLKGRVTSRGIFEGQVVLWVRNVETAPGPNEEFTSDSREWGVVLGAASKTSPEILDRLGNRDIVVRGYGAKDTSCVPACIIAGRDITLPSGEKFFSGTATQPPQFRPAPPRPAPDAAPAEPKPQPIEIFNRRDNSELLPDLVPFARYFDAKSPVLLKGRVTRVESFEGHAALLVEEIETTTPGAIRVPYQDVKVVWTVVLGRLEGAPAWSRDATLIGKTIEIRGYRAKEKCELECLMAGRDVYLAGETLPGWQAPVRKPPAPKPNPPPI
jgi:hypothetical protein